MQADAVKPPAPVLPADSETQRAQTQLAAIRAQTRVTRKLLAGLRAELRELQKQASDLRARQVQPVDPKQVLTALQTRTVADAALAELQSLRHNSEHDSLTGLANRRLLMRRMQHSLAAARREGGSLAVLFVDIDDFRRVNDARGHVAGDAVLKRVADCLTGAVGAEDVVSRHGGEEFIVLLPQAGDMQAALSTAERIHHGLTQVTDAADDGTPISVSIGIAVYPEAAESAVSLIDHADAAMYQARRAGVGKTMVYRPGTTEFDSGSADVGKRSERLRAAGDLQQLQITLREANQALLLSALSAQEHGADAQAAQARQARFLAIVAHELRNPLTPILTAASLLDRADADPVLVKRMQVVIEEQVMHMVRLIDDLLDRSRANAGKFRLDLRTVDFAEVVRSTVSACTPGLRKREQQLELNLPVSGAATLVSGDRVRLLQVCTNLLENASKYTPEGGAIRVSLAIEIDYLTLSVSDNGIGIIAADMPHIFDLFAQDPRAVRYHSGGLGIGLAVVRELVEAHGGSVLASSAGRDLGTQFVVTLPLASANSAPQQEFFG